MGQTLIRTRQAPRADSRKSPAGRPGVQRLSLRRGALGVALGFGVFAMGALPGCSVSRLATADRYSRGLIMILPGIEGRSWFNSRLANGLESGGIPAAIEIYEWGIGNPAGLLIHLTAIERNRRQAERIADRIISYQQDFPGRPVHLIGHSAGAGIAILTLEQLPPDHPVTSVYLLAAAISPKYNLSKALERTELGIWNFYSNQDVGFLAVGTSVFGTVDRSHTAAAGAVGFSRPERLSDRGKHLYETRLHDAQFNRRMKDAGATGGHLGWTEPEFARKWLAPMLLADARARSASPYSLTATRAQQPSKPADKAEQMEPVP